MNEIYQSQTKADTYPISELNARRVLLIQEHNDRKRNNSAVNPNLLSSSARLDTVPAKLEILSDEQNFTSFNVCQHTDGMLAQVLETQANMLLLVIDQLTPNLIEQLSNMNRLVPLVVVVFARKHYSETVPNLISAGIDSYNVGCSGRAFDTIDLAVILDVAEYHFAHVKTLKSELAQTQKQLSDRKLIERAKGILMEHHNLSERQAYAQMRRSAMNQGSTMVGLAHRLMSVFETSF